MRSLLDILNEEKGLVNRLEKIEKDVELAKVINTFSSESKAILFPRYAEQLVFSKLRKRKSKRNFLKFEPN